MLNYWNGINCSEPSKHGGVGWVAPSAARLENLLKLANRLVRSRLVSAKFVGRGITLQHPFHTVEG